VIVPPAFINPCWQIPPRSPAPSGWMASLTRGLARNSRTCPAAATLKIAPAQV